jgi:glycine oxidase
VTLPGTPDVLVVGGGIVGCAVARELAAAGRLVLVVDRGAIGAEASSAAAGVLAVASGEDEGDRLELRRAALAGFPTLVAALREEAGMDVGFERCGVVALAKTDEEREALASRVARRRAQGLAADPCDVATVRGLVAEARPDATGGAFFADDAVVVAERLTAALASSARRHGATLVPGVPVVAVEARGDRVVRVRAGDDWIEPETIVLATGAWGARGVAALDAGADVVPIRGQMLALRPRRSPRHVIACGSAFLVPRPHGEAWVGATFEPAFTKAVTAEGIRLLAEHVERVAPAMLGAPIVRTWAGLRPYCRAGRPVIGRGARHENVLVALGHYRNGILLAALTAVAIRACAEGREVPAAVRPFVRD